MSTPALNEWFFASFDDEAVYLEVRPPGAAVWNERIRWEKITRVCFKAGDFLESDEIYIFTDERPESRLIPVDANGGNALWNEILRRRLFDAELAVKAAVTEGEVFCTPDH